MMSNHYLHAHKGGKMFFKTVFQFMRKCSISFFKDCKGHLKPCTSFASEGDYSRGLLDRSESSNYHMEG